MPQATRGRLERSDRFEQSGSRLATSLEMPWSFQSRAVAPPPGCRPAEEPLALLAQAPPSSGNRVRRRFPEPLHAAWVSCRAGCTSGASNGKDLGPSVLTGVECSLL